MEEPKRSKSKYIIIYYLIIENYIKKKVRKTKKEAFMKKIISFTVEEDLVQWLTKYSQSQSKYRNKSHLVEVALRKLKQEEETERRNNREITRTGKQKSHAQATST